MNGPKLFKNLSISTILIALLCLMSFSANALTTVTVTPVTTYKARIATNSGTVKGAAITNYRWVIEEDQTYNTIPGQTCTGGAATNLTNYSDCLSLNFHKSHMPVIAQGRSSTAAPTNWSALGLSSTKRYFISILPDKGEFQALGGAQIAAGQAAVNVIITANDVASAPSSDMPTAQIRVFIFDDSNPTDNVPQPGEKGLEGFSILLEDAGGRYGISGQQINKDAYGNPLGSKYVNGTLSVLGDGVILTDANGEAMIKNIAPGKYGIRAVPGPGIIASTGISYADYVQTSTIEGTPTIDAWVKADEPPYFAEFGPPGPHVFMGFVKGSKNIIPASAGGATISGTVRSIHNSRPPAFDFFDGAVVPGCLVALNESRGGIAGKNLFVASCNADSTFSIPNVPPGFYSLSIWDKALGYIFGQYAFGVAAGDTAITIDPSLFAWFARIEQNVFFDTNANGIKDNGEAPIAEIATSIRWRDGTLYQAFKTDRGGSAPYDQVFPFFSWLVAEVDFSRYKATGVSVIVDAGGKPDAGQPYKAQLQPDNNNAPSRTEVGPVLTQAFQGFLGQTSVINWGKQLYNRGENGGISGIVYYAVTRAEDDPHQAAAEFWEPGIPRIQVSLYQQDRVTKEIKDQNGNGIIDRADVDNHPLGWKTGGAKGAEDFDYNANGVFDAGDAIQITTTDSWDDSIPTNCVGAPFTVDGYPTDCFDGLRNFNQVRPGVFDGGYAFTSYFPGGYGSGSAEVASLPIGEYIVATGDHPAYETVKEEDKNVDFGANFIQPNLLLPECTGTRTTPVPTEFSLFPGTTSDYLTAQSALATPPPFCNEKLAQLNGGKNAAVDFFMFTQVPVAGHIMGFILNDLANEFDPNAPTFGEKFSPPFIPVAIKDWQGNVIGRTYSDRWGSFNVLVPSTFSENLPTSSGISPNMLTACMNDPGPIRNAAGNMVVDPYFKKNYSQFCYTFNYMPGVTTYLDTPILPIAAFAGVGQEVLDCDYQTGTPVIWSAKGDGPAGPIVSGVGVELTLMSVGLSTVINPQATTPGQLPTITRDYGFGPQSIGAKNGEVTIDGVAVPVTLWTTNMITLNIPRGGNLEIKRADGRRSQVGIHVTIDDVNTNVVYVPIGGNIQATIDGPLVTTGTTVVIPQGTFTEMVVMSKPIRLQGSGASTIIDAANVPSTKIFEWNTLVNDLVNAKKVHLLPKQETGQLLPEQITLFTEAGAGITVLAKNTTPKLGGFGLVNVLSLFNPDGTPIINPGTGLPITTAVPVITLDAEGNEIELKDTVARIDGIAITGSDNGGGIVVNGYANDLEISNNKIFGNYGVFGGGIRLGHPTLINRAGNDYEHALNNNIKIHHNYVSGNGSGNGVGGGISLNHGSDSYSVTKNYICGNFTSGNGGGIGHFGLGNPLSPHLSNSLIEDNIIIFNQSFSQGKVVSGGGIFIGGANSFNANPLSPGAGSIVIDANLIQGNNAGAGDGGGISLSRINGTDVVPGAKKGDLHKITMTNNIIVNNVAGFAGGGISLVDAVRTKIVNNTIAHNDSSATSGESFCTLNAAGIRVCSKNESQPRPAGLVSYTHSFDLKTALAASAVKAKLASYSNPTFANNIVWKNRAFYFLIDRTTTPSTFGLVPYVNPLVTTNPSLAGIYDYAVLGGGVNDIFKPISSLLTYATVKNVEGNNIAPNVVPGTSPDFVNAYFNAPVGQTLIQREVTTTLLSVQPAFDEPGNFIDVRFSPLSLTLPATGTGDLGSNYHIAATSSAIGGLGGEAFRGDTQQILFDFDNNSRLSNVDVGADQYNQVSNTTPEIVNGIAINSFVIESVSKTGIVNKATTATTNPATNTGGFANFISGIFSSTNSAATTTATDSNTTVADGTVGFVNTEKASASDSENANETATQGSIDDSISFSINEPVSPSANSASVGTYGGNTIVPNQNYNTMPVDNTEAVHQVVITEQDTIAKKAAIAQKYAIVEKAKADAKAALARKAKAEARRAAIMEKVKASNKKSNAVSKRKSGNKKTDTVGKVKPTTKAKKGEV